MTKPQLILSSGALNLDTYDKMFLKYEMIFLTELQKSFFVGPDPECSRYIDVKFLKVNPRDKSLYIDNCLLNRKSITAKRLLFVNCEPTNWLPSDNTIYSTTFYTYSLVLTPRIYKTFKSLGDQYVDFQYWKTTYHIFNKSEIDLLISKLVNLRVSNTDEGTIDYRIENSYEPLPLKLGVENFLMDVDDRESETVLVNDQTVVAKFKISTFARDLNAYLRLRENATNPTRKNIHCILDIRDAIYSCGVINLGMKCNKSAITASVYDLFRHFMYYIVSKDEGSTQTWTLEGYDEVEVYKEYGYIVTAVRGLSKLDGLYINEFLSILERSNPIESTQLQKEREYMYSDELNFFLNNVINPDEDAKLYFKNKNILQLGRSVYDLYRIFINESNKINTFKPPDRCISANPYLPSHKPRDWCSLSNVASSLISTVSSNKFSIQIHFDEFTNMVDDFRLSPWYEKRVGWSLAVSR